MKPVGQSSSRSVKTENDTLTPVRTAGAVRGAVSAIPGGNGGDSRGVSFFLSRMVPVTLLLFVVVHIAGFGIGRFLSVSAF